MIRGGGSSVAPVVDPTTAEYDIPLTATVQGSATTVNWYTIQSADAAVTAADLKGSSTTTYTPTMADVGKWIVAEAVYGTTTVLATAIGPVPVIPPEINSSAPTQGTPLTATVPASATVNWYTIQSADAAVTEADLKGSTTTYEPTLADVGKWIVAGAVYGDTTALATAIGPVIDVTLPTVESVAVTVGYTDATFECTLTEPCKLFYSTGAPVTQATRTGDQTASFLATHTIVLGSLTPDQAYTLSFIAVDASDNASSVQTHGFSTLSIPQVVVGYRTHMGDNAVIDADAPSSTMALDAFKAKTGGDTSRVIVGNVKQTSLMVQWYHDSSKTLHAVTLPHDDTAPTIANIESHSGVIHANVADTEHAAHITGLRAGHEYKLYYKTSSMPYIQNVVVKTKARRPAVYKNASGALQVKGGGIVRWKLKNGTAVDASSYDPADVVGVEVEGDINVYSTSIESNQPLLSFI